MNISRREFLQMLDVNGSFADYVGKLFLKGFLFIGLPALPLGAVFPFLMKIEERFTFQPGRSVDDEAIHLQSSLSAINSA